MSAILNYIKGSYEELKNHITWTPKAELQRLTVIVLVFTLLFSLLIWLADTALSRIIKTYFQLIDG